MRVVEAGLEVGLLALAGRHNTLVGLTEIEVGLELLEAFIELSLPHLLVLHHFVVAQVSHPHFSRAHQEPPSSSLEDLLPVGLRNLGVILQKEGLLRQVLANVGLGLGSEVGGVAHGPSRFGVEVRGRTGVWMRIERGRLGRFGLGGCVRLLQ